MKRWINICFVGGTVQCAEDFYYTTGLLYESKQEADSVQTANRIACIEVEFDETDGKET